MNYSSASSNVYDICNNKTFMYYISTGQKNQIYVILVEEIAPKISSAYLEMCIAKVSRLVYC